MSKPEDIIHSTSHKTHDFLSEELLIPNVNKSSANRINMFCSNVMQAVVLKKGEKPLVFTNFENQIGSISHAYRVLDRRYEVLDVVDKDEFGYSKYVIIKDDDGKVDMIHIKDCHNITEEYGFVYKNYLTNVKKGDILDKDTLVYHSTAYDENLNLTYGTNLKAIYYPMKGITYEDGIVISESAAKKLTHYTITEVTVSINTNDVLLNLYGDDTHYKCLPEIGSYTKDGVVCARRRLDYNTMLRSMTNESLRNIDSPDTLFYARGEVVDIQVFCNNTKEALSKNDYNSQILDILADQEICNEKLFETIDKLRSSGAEMSDDLSYQYARIKDMMDESKRYIINGSSFDNLVVKIKVKEEHPAKIGSKITNRYGGKGVISKIIPDNEMPCTEDGEYADMCLNPLGVINRMNLSQLYEHEINFVGSHVRNLMKTQTDMFAGFDLMLDFVEAINPAQADSMYKFIDTLDDSELEEFYDDLITNGIPVHQPPFWENISFEQMGQLYSKFGATPKKFKDIEKPLIIAEIYYIKLKHEASGKLSARSCGSINLKGVMVRPLYSNVY